MKHKCVIFLTACVNPGGMANTLHTDCRQRMEEYKEALCFYLQKTKLPIVFCENTLCDMSGEFSSYIASGRLEYLTFDGNHYDKRRGKGVGEIEILEYAFLHSKLLQDGTHIIKITGRLKVLNIKSLIAVRKMFGDNCIQLRISEDGVFTQSQFFIAPMLFLKEYFIPLGEMIDDRQCCYFEHVLGYSIKNQAEYCVIPFFNFPLIDGISGTFGTHYNIHYTLLEKMYYVRKTIYKCIIFDNRYAQKKQNILERLLIKCYYGVIFVIIFVSRKINEI